MSLLELVSRKVVYEQAVYGSFPFWRLGYGVLARSEGCRGEWLDALRVAGQRFGERPTAVAEHSSLLAIPIPRGPWMIVGVFPGGSDDHDRPGALVFHGLFLTRWMYRKASRSPFAFTGALKQDWGERDVNSTLPTGSLTVPFWNHLKPADRGPADPRVARVVAAIKQKRRVVIPAADPIDALARAVWDALPGSSRRRASMATWAFNNDNRFDLVAVPRPGALAPDSRELILELET